MSKNSTFADLLGFPEGARVVIFNIDDAGLCAGTNDGVKAVFERGVTASASLMMPCGAALSFVNYIQRQEQYDIGLHLTLTCEFRDEPWGPLDDSHSPSFVDSEGKMWPTVNLLVKNASIEDVKRELEAQISFAAAHSVRPTHYDCHMFALLSNSEYLDAYVDLGLKYRLPLVFPVGHATHFSKHWEWFLKEYQPGFKLDLPEFKKRGLELWGAGIPVIDDLHIASILWELPAGTPCTIDNLRTHKTEYFKGVIKSLNPGITAVALHCAAVDEHNKTPFYLSESRWGDYLAFCNVALKDFVDSERVIVTSWRELSERIKSLPTN